MRKKYAFNFCLVISYQNGSRVLESAVSNCNNPRWRLVLVKDALTSSDLVWCRIITNVSEEGISSTEDGDVVSVKTSVTHLRNHIASQFRGPPSTSSPPCKPQIGKDKDIFSNIHNKINHSHMNPLQFPHCKRFLILRMQNKWLKIYWKAPVHVSLTQTRVKER